MPSSHNAERRREPVYTDEFGAIHHPPASRPRPRPRYDDGFVREEKRPRRAQTYRAPRPPSSASSSLSPPPPRHRRHPSPGPYDDYYAPRRRHAREEDYFSDNRHNRPRRNPYDDRPPRREHRDRRERGAPPREKEKEKRPEPDRKESRWQKEAKEMFKEYAVPVIKAEGGKYISKQLGNMIAKQVT